MTWSTNAEMMSDLRAAAYAEACDLRAELPVPVLVPRDPAAVDHYRLNVTCPRCDGPLRHITASPPARSLTIDLRAIAECAACDDRWVIAVNLSSDTTCRKRREGADRALEHQIAIATAERHAENWRVSA